MPTPKFSHCLMIIGPDSLPITSSMIRIVPEDVVDDTPHRFALLLQFATMVLGPSFPLTTQSQVWTFWEAIASPSGFSIGVIEGPSESKPAPIFADPPSAPPAEKPADDVTAAEPWPEAQGRA